MKIGLWLNANPDEIRLACYEWFKWADDDNWCWKEDLAITHVYDYEMKDGRKKGER